MANPNESTVEKPRRGRPPENRELWKTVLRLPATTAAKLKAAVKQFNDEFSDGRPISINSTIESIIKVWLDTEDDKKRD